MRKYVQDKVAIVTGAGGGLGRSHALELARQGARVLVNATRMILLAGVGSFECANITMTHGVHIGDTPDAAGEVRARLPEIASRAGETVPGSGWEQYRLELAKAGFKVDPASSS